MVTETVIKKVIETETDTFLNRRIRFLIMFVFKFSPLVEQLNCLIIESLIHHNHHLGWLCFFFSNTTKRCFHSDFFTAIFLISLTSSFISPGKIWREIWLRNVVLDASGRRDDLILDSYMTKRLAGLSASMRIHWPVSLKWRSRIVSQRGAWLVRSCLSRGLGMFNN